MIKAVPVLKLLGEMPDIDIQIVSTGQHPVHVVTRAWEELSSGIFLGPTIEHTDDWELRAKFSLLDNVGSAKTVLAIGDTNSARIAIEAAAIKGATGIHLEAGLRLPIVDEPEEYNRRLMTCLSRWHLAPYEEQRLNLVNDGIDPSYIRVIGDLTMASLSYRLNLGQQIRTTKVIESRYVLFTLHRWSNLRRLDAIESFLEHQIRQLSDEWRFVVVMRSDSRLSGMYERLGSIGCVLLEDQSPREFLNLLSQCDVVLTDSAGVQQEAVLLGRPCGVLRRGVELYGDAYGLTLDVDDSLDIGQLIDQSEAYSDFRGGLADWRQLASRAVSSIVEILYS
jgi:UDP-N-acetylglucosamine 2-epimerase (non-hydrolysing)